MSTRRSHPVSDLDDCPCAGRHLDKFIQPAVLTVLAGEPLHGYRIVQCLGRMPMFHGRKPDATGVYRFLKAMEDRGLVRSAWDLSDTGPAKRLFDLTRDGRKCLARWIATLEEYHQQVGQMVRLLRGATAGHGLTKLSASGKAKGCGCGSR
ncbi:MAG: PadR family transcriptional regulator [Phycisphaerae bacterium]